MNINEFCYTLDICLGNEKVVIEKFFKKYVNSEKDLRQFFKLCQEIGIIDKNLKYSYDNLVNALANYKNAEEFLINIKIDDLKKDF